MGVFTRGTKLWIRYCDEHGKWQNIPTPHRLGEEQLAQAKFEALVALVDRTKASSSPAMPGAAAAAILTPLTVRGWANRWLADRRNEGKAWESDKRKLDLHVLPAIGDLAIASVRTRHIIELAHRWRTTVLESTGEVMAPKTVYNVYDVTRLMFRDAQLAEEIDQQPCILTESQLGPKRDKDPEWRAGAVFTRDEAQTLISTSTIPWDRRVTYAIELLTGARTGESAALRWRHYDATRKPLGELLVAVAFSSDRNLVKGTKTEAVKHVPVHPTLAAILAEWKLSGWEQMMGRAPGPDDLIVPMPPADAAKRRSRFESEPMRTNWYACRRWREDLAMLGWRDRRHYDMRATFITLALDDGADPDVIETRVTHTRKRRSAFDGYNRGQQWAITCAEVAKLHVARVAEDQAVSAVAGEPLQSSLQSTGFLEAEPSYRVEIRGIERAAKDIPQQPARATPRLRVVERAPSVAEQRHEADVCNGPLQRDAETDAIADALAGARASWLDGGDRRRLRRELVRLLAELEDE